MLRNGGGAIGGGKGASSVAVVVAFMLFLKLAYTTHSSGGEIQNEVTQKREKIFEFFAKKKNSLDGKKYLSFVVLSLLLWVVAVVAVVASARCSFLSSVVAEEERTWTGEQCDTRRAKTHAYIKKRARFYF
jgi:Ca2+/H+ antiporter